MEVGHRFAGLGAVVDHEAEARGKLELLRHEFRYDEQVSENGFVGRRGLADANDRLFGDDQEMDGGLGLNVADDDAVLVLMLDGRRNLAIDDALENGLGHGFCFYRRKRRERRCY